MRRWLPLFSLACTLVLFTPGYGAARPLIDNAGRIPPMRPIMTTYDVYVGGIHFLTADVLFEEQGNHYATHVHGRTYGIIYKFLKWDGIVVAQGNIKDGQFVPTSFVNYDSWRNKLKKTEIDFDKKGAIAVSFDPTQNIDHPVSDEQKKGALDPAAALLQMLGHIAATNDCTVSVPVFDGKRRFDLNGTDEGTEYVDDGDYSAYSGDARLCNVDFTMIAGEWKEKDKNHRFWEHKDGQPARDPFHVWLASLDQGLPEIPIRLESTSAWGNLIVHLSKWHYATSDEIKAEATEDREQFVKTSN